MEQNNEKKENQITETQTLAEEAMAVKPDRADSTAPQVTAQSSSGLPPTSGEPPPTKKEEPSFEELYEGSIKPLEEGQIIKGTVVRVGKEHVMVDIGFKSEGQIKLAEVTDSKGEIKVKPGDIIDVLIERREDDNGVIILSKEKADKVRVWEELEKAFQAQEPINGKIVKKVKGGLTVDIGVPAFLPGSQVDLRPIRTLDTLVNTESKFKILKFNRKRGNVVVSRRAVLEEEKAKKRAETLKLLEPGRILPGTVKNIVDYGAFIDLGGIDGLLHVTDMSWGRIKHPNELLQVGQQIKTVVLKFDKENERVSLGLKQLAPDPWDTVNEKYPVGTKVKGKVVNITDYGAFVEMELGVEGLIHVSEMSWTKRVRHPSKIVQVGQEVEVMVLDIDKANRKISLGLKQIEPNPWDVAKEKFPIGTVIRGRIRNITDFGIFIGVMEGIDGLVHISDISWTKRIRHPSELYKKGQEVEAVVLNIDKETERFSLGIKQLTSDPWSTIRERMRPGDTVTGKVVNVTEFGIFLELEEGIEGLIHISELPQEKTKNLSEHFKAEQKLKVEILNIDPDERKIRLSLKAVEEKASQEEIKQYAGGRGNATVKIADLLGDHLAAAKAVANAGKIANETEEKSSVDESKSQNEDTKGEKSD